MKRMRIFLFVIAILWSVFPAWPATKQFVVTTTTIADALNKAGVEVTPEHVTMLAQVLSRRPDPGLKLRSIGKSANQQVVARLECEDTGDCLPFLVVLDPGPGVMSALSAPAASKAAIASFKTSTTFAIRTGAIATLELEGEHIHITIPVICAENGAVGQTVRVTDRDRRVAYRAEVVDSRLLKGRLH
jgi:hypothetical protein